MTDTPARPDAALLDGPRLPGMVTGAPVARPLLPGMSPEPSGSTGPPAGPLVPMARADVTAGVPDTGGSATLDAYLGLMSAFPTGVAVVTAAGPDGVPYGLTCTSLTSVTLRPPTLLVCIDVRSATLRAARAHGRFAVNLLHARGRRAAEVFSRPSSDRFSQVAWRPTPRARLPWLTEDAFAVAECALVSTSVVGDHAVVVGEVAHVHQVADVPLMYGHRRFARWSGDTP